MLEALVVSNYALIERLEVRFTPGLNILTGETGAGKSILVGALGLLLGLKADPEAVRAGAEEAGVSGVIRLEGNREALAWLEAQGIKPEEGAIIVRRSVRRNGKGTLFVQDSPLTLAGLRELTSLLFDMHGQHEHQSLLTPDNHRKLLDRYGDCTSQVEEFGAAHARLLVADQQFDSFRGLHGADDPGDRHGGLLPLCLGARALPISFFRLHLHERGCR